MQVEHEKTSSGLTIFLTGLSGAGKTTLAQMMAVKLAGNRGRKTTVLDGDEVRHYLAQELGFSKEHREINVRRVGFVAGEITKHGGIAICALIAPYAAGRQKNRHLINKHGGYVEVYVSTPLTVCEMRDSKGLYAKARQGLIQQFTGLSDPYETPENPELIIDTSKLGPEEAVDQIINYLKKEGYVD